MYIIYLLLFPQANASDSFCKHVLILLSNDSSFLTLKVAEYLK